MSILCQKRRYRQCWLLSILLFVLVACDSNAVPTAAPVAEEPALEADVPATDEPVPPTFTAVPTSTFTPAPTEPPPATSTPIPTATPLPPTSTPRPTDTPVPTDTPLPTNTPVPIPPTAVAPQPPAAPTIGPNPVFGANILPNGSFEEGHYNKNGVPELQLPNGWDLEWDEGPTGYGGQSWDVYVRPEIRVLPSPFLPEHERDLFIYDGDTTVKLFKGQGAISIRLFRNVNLEPGTYRFEINVFPDMYEDFREGEKIWASDPFSAEYRFIVGGGGSGWIQPAFGQRNTNRFEFTVDEAEVVRLGVWFRGRYAIANNGYFTDAWSLRRLQ